MPLAGREFCRIRRRDARSEAIVACRACGGIGTSCCQSLAAEAIQANIRDAGDCGTQKAESADQRAVPVGEPKQNQNQTVHVGNYRDGVSSLDLSQY